MNSMFILGGENILLIKKRQFHNFQSMEANMARKTWLLKKLLEQLTQGNILLHKGNKF